MGKKFTKKHTKRKRRINRKKVNWAPVMFLVGCGMVLVLAGLVVWGGR